MTLLTKQEIAALVEALEHMRWCRHCAEGHWLDCDGGCAAEAALAAFKEPRHD